MTGARILTQIKPIHTQMECRDSFQQQQDSSVALTHATPVNVNTARPDTFSRGVYI